MRPFIFILAVLCVLAALPAAALEITEVMYDAPGADADHEWIEIYNNDDTAIDSATLKLFESNSNHGITVLSGGQSIDPGSYAVITDADTEGVFTAVYPSFSGTLLHSSFSLVNTGETVAIKRNDTIVASATYPANMGAAGDGDTLSYSDGSWHVSNATPGALNADGSNDTDNDDVDGQPDYPTENATSMIQSGLKKNQAIVLTYGLTAAMDTVIVVGKMHSYMAKPVRTVGSDTFAIRHGVYEWAMGDGTAYLKQNNPTIEHAYAYPGTYQMILSYYTSKLTYEEGTPFLTLKKKIAVLKPTLEVSGSVADGTITIAHASSEDFDIAGWQLHSGGNMFTFPRNTILLARTAYTFTPRQLNFSYIGGPIDLLYPTGEVFGSSAPVKETSSTRTSMAKPDAYYAQSSLVATPAPAVETLLNNPIASDMPDNTKNAGSAAFVILAVFLGLVIGAISIVLFLSIRFQDKKSFDYRVRDDDAVDVLPVEDIIELSEDEEDEI